MENIEIARAVIDNTIMHSNNTEEENKLVDKFMAATFKGYTLVEWPEVQELMEYDWFQTEAILDVDYKASEITAYLISLNRIMEL